MTSNYTIRLDAGLLREAETLWQAIQAQGVSFPVRGKGGRERDAGEKRACRVKRFTLWFAANVTAVQAW